MSDDIPEGIEPDMAAAELALGLIEGEERATALRRVLADTAFARDVEWWRGRLAHLFDIWPEITPSAGVLARVERSIDALVVPGLAIAKPNRFWPALAAATTALAAVLLAVVVLRPEPPQPRPVVVAQTPKFPAALPAMLVAAIDPVANGAPVSAVYDPASGGLRLSAAALADADRSAELWIIGKDATPHSLGLLRTAGSSTFTVSPATRAQLAAGGLLAVTLEAVGGSSTGAPQGPIVAKGVLSRV